MPFGGEACCSDLFSDYVHSIVSNAWTLLDIYLLSCIGRGSLDRYRGLRDLDQTRKNTYGRAQGGDCSTLPLTTVSTYK